MSIPDFSSNHLKARKNERTLSVVFNHSTWVWSWCRKLLSQNYSLLMPTRPPQQIKEKWPEREQEKIKERCKFTCYFQSKLQWTGEVFSILTKSLCKVKLKHSKKEDGSHLHLRWRKQEEQEAKQRKKRMDERKVPKCLPPRPCRQLFFPPESDQPDLEKINEVLCNVETVLKNLE